MKGVKKFKRIKWRWVVLWSLWAARVLHQPTDPVQTSGGLVRGGIAPDGSHKYYLAIPYASFVERFQAPGPEPKWDGIYEAMDENIYCHQRIDRTNIVIGQDQCLILNVYTPLNAAPGDKLPVMFFIHGGGYFYGSSSRLLYGPEFLVPKGVILVSINYRLNIQGFLCLGTKEAPGNAALKDMVAALKWVQRNIKAFGGDPDNVTIFGESAGAGSVSYLVLSPLAKGLFHKAITQSGSSLAAWASQYRPVYMASLLSKVMGYKTEDPKELYDIFQNKTDAELILTRVPRKKGNTCISEVLYVPCVEQNVEGEEAFVKELPYDLLTKGEYNKVPMMIGVNSQEGYLFIAIENSTMLKEMTFEQSLLKDLVFPTQEERQEVAATVEKMYMGDEKISNDTVLKVSRLLGEPYFMYPSIQEAELIAKTNDKPVYSYVFNYNGWRNLPKISLGWPYVTAEGAAHADELMYLFKLPSVPVLFEGQMVERMTTLWTNFAKYGDPTPAPTELLPVKWAPVDRSSPTSLLIDAKFSTIPLWYKDSLKYWKEVYSKYRRKGD